MRLPEYVRKARTVYYLVVVTLLVFFCFGDQFVIPDHEFLAAIGIDGSYRDSITLPVNYYCTLSR
jgi:hypothetical protein